MSKKDRLEQKDTNCVIKNPYSRDCLFPAINIKTGKNNIRKMRYYKQAGVKNKVILGLLGSVIGLVNGFFGGGGGMICVPALQKACFLNQKQSHATAILVILPLSIMSAVVYSFNGYVELFPLLSVGGGVVLGGIFGALLLKKISSKILQIIFVLLMLGAGVRLII